MTVKSLRKQLAAAIAMTLVAMVALGSSTYAWFAANTEVTANGMSVTAKSDTTFLLIKQGAVDADTVQAAKKTEDAAITSSDIMYPTAHTDSVTNTATANTVGNWYYKYSTDPTVYGGENKETAATVLTTLDEYVLVNTFSITVADGSNVLDNLKVGSVTINTEGDAAVKVLVTSAGACEEFSGAGGTGTVVLASSVTSEASIPVNIYVYWDGTDADVFTNNIEELLNTSVVVTFVGTARPNNT
jgi:hypothetical protein